MHRLNSDASKGFTLIELLLVIALFGLLTSFIVPQMIGFNRRQVLRNEALELTDNLKRARSLAESGVQGEASFIAAYRFTPSQQAGDPAGAYRGFDISRHDSANNQVGGVFYSSRLQCPVCINSTTPMVEFAVPQGKVSGFAGASATYQVCYPGQGEYSVMVENNGRIYSSDFIASSCSCAVNVCN